MNLIAMFAQKAKSCDDAKLMRTIRGFGYSDEVLRDWKNWGLNPQKVYMEEAYRRGLLEEGE